MFEGRSRRCTVDLDLGAVLYGVIYSLIDTYNRRTVFSSPRDRRRIQLLQSFRCLLWFVYVPSVEWDFWLSENKSYEFGKVSWMVRWPSRYDTAPVTMKKAHILFTRTSFEWLFETLHTHICVRALGVAIVTNFLQIWQKQSFLQIARIISLVLGNKFNNIFLKFGFWGCKKYSMVGGWVNLNRNIKPT